MVEILSTQRLTARTWNETDFDTFAEIYNDDKVIQYIGGQLAFTESELKKRFKLEQSRYETFEIQYFPIYLENHVIGVCGFRPTEQENTIEFGIHIKPDYWGKGYAYEISYSMLGYANKKHIGKRIIAGHNPLNFQSKKLLAKLGFEYLYDLYYEPTGLKHPTYEYNHK